MSFVVMPPMGFGTDDGGSQGQGHHFGSDHHHGAGHSDGHQSFVKPGPQTGIKSPGLHHGSDGYTVGIPMAKVPPSSSSHNQGLVKSKLPTQPGPEYGSGSKSLHPANQGIPPTQPALFHPKVSVGSGHPGGAKMTTGRISKSFGKSTTGLAKSTSSGITGKQASHSSTTSSSHHKVTFASCYIKSGSGFVYSGTTLLGKHCGIYFKDLHNNIVGKFIHHRVYLWSCGHYVDVGYAANATQAASILFETYHAGGS